MVELSNLVNEINLLESQGKSNNEIIQILQKKGHNYTEISNAFTQKKLGGKNTMQEPTQNQMPNSSQAPNPFSNQATNQQNQEPIPSIDPGSFGETNEELIETIIEEKWNELIKDINKIISWKNRTEEKIVRLEQQFKDLKDQFDELHRAVIGKVGEYDKNILNVGAEIKAMEKVFSNVLPVFINNVKTLNDITNKFKIVSKTNKENK